MIAIASSPNYSKTLAESYSLPVTDYKIVVKHLETASTIFPMKNIIVI